MSTLQTLFLFLAAGMVLCWLILAASGPAHSAPSGVIAVLRYGSVFRTAALIAALTPPMLMGYLVLAIRWPNATYLAIAGGTLFAMGVLVGLLYLEVAATEVVLTEDGITRASPWTGPLTLRWSEVKQVRYSPLNRWFIVAGTRGTIRISRHLAGIHALGQTLQRKVPVDRWLEAARILTEK